jgi:hypothetical protein
VGHLQKRSALQAEKAEDFELRKTTTFDASAQPKLLLGDLALECARLTNTRLMAVGYSTGFGDQFRASQAAGVSSAIRLIGKLAKPGKIEPR